MLIYMKLNISYKLQIFGNIGDQMKVTELTFYIINIKRKNISDEMEEEKHFTYLEVRKHFVSLFLNLFRYD